MSKQEIKKQIDDLRAEIEKHRVAYYVYDKPTISDEVYDSLMKKLILLEEAHPEFDSKNSPSKRVGGPVLGEFKKVRHQFSQWSYDNVFDFTELSKWEERNLKILEKAGISKKMTYLTELKIDGLKVVLTYESGELVLAATRGDGEVGEDVTENIRTIRTVPLVIDEKKDLVVVGEVWLGKNDFEKINKERAKENLELYANPRNVAAGTLRQLDPKIVAKRNLKFFAYDIPETKLDQKERNEKLKKLGFWVNDMTVYCKDLQEIQKFYDKWNGEKRFAEDYGIDGVVIKVNEQELTEMLGYTAKSPRFGIAYKFSAEEAVSKVLAVTFQVGRTGVVTPVAELEAVQLSGSTVKRATLHNFDEIERLGIKVGDQVMVRKAGDIIPQVFDVLKSLRAGNEKEIKVPKKCPECKSDLVKDTEGGGVKLACINDFCKEKIINKIIYFASKKNANIEDLGESTIRLFYDLKIIQKISDIYKLKAKDIEGLEGFKEKSINNLLTSIENSRTQNLERFISSLSINGVGEETAIDLARNFKTFENFKTAVHADLLTIYGIGEKTIEEIENWQKNNEVQKEVGEILKFVSVSDYKDNSKSKKLSDLRFVITGTFKEHSRDQIEQIIKENGGSVQSAVNAKTSYLVVGEDAGSKLEKAKKLGVKTISISDFSRLIS